MFCISIYLQVAFYGVRVNNSFGYLQPHDDKAENKKIKKIRIRILIYFYKEFPKSASSQSEGTIGCSLQPAIGYVSVRTSLTIARARAQEMGFQSPKTQP